MVVAGSGKFGTPCPRMQLAIASICVMVAADGFSDAAAAPARTRPSFAHAFWANSNPDEVSIPGGVWRLTWAPPAPKVGSGKLCTPCERMHRAAASWDRATVEGLEGRLLVLLDVLDDPQPAITSTPDTTTTAVDTR